MSRKQEIEAASDLEKLIPDIKQLAFDLRRGKGQAYARVYAFRREVSRIVASLGAGYPGKVHDD